MMRPMLSPSELKALNAQSWADFRAHWPMHLVDVLVELGGGFIFGVALSLSAFVYVLELLA